MALIVEDGSIVADANSYTTSETIIAYAAARGVVVPEDKAETFAIKAVDFIEMQRDKLRGVETSPGLQALAFPRTGLIVGTLEYADDVIPPGIIRAQCQLCIEQANGVVLIPSKASAASAKFVTKKKIGPIETEYSEAMALAAIGDSALPEMPAVDALLRPFLRSNVLRAYRG